MTQACAFTFFLCEHGLEDGTAHENGPVQVGTQDLSQITAPRGGEQHRNRVTRYTHRHTTITCTYALGRSLTRQKDAPVGHLGKRLRNQVPCAVRDTRGT